MQLQFSLAAHPELGSATLSLREIANGRWQGSGSELSIAGRWSVSVLVQEPTTGVTVPLTLNVGSATGP